MADITITIPDEHVERVRDAFTYELGPVATTQTVKDFLVAELRQFVRGAEVRMAEEAATNPTEIDFS